MEQANGFRQDLTVAGHDVLLELSEEVFTQGDVISGSLTVSLSDDGKEPGGLTVKLQEFFRRAEEDESDALTTRTRVRTEKKLKLREFVERTVVRRGANSFQLARGYCYAFQFRLPRGCRVSQDLSGWRLSVTLRNELGVYPDTEFVKLEVRIADELQAVLDTWQIRMKFTEVLARRRWDERALTTSLWLTPPKVLAGELDGVSLELSQGDGGSVEGRVVFDLQEKSVADYLKSLIKQDLVPFDLALPATEVLTDAGEPNVDALSQVFGAMMEKALAGR